MFTFYTNKHPRRIRRDGLLHIPEMPTSWFRTQRWLYLDPSWKMPRDVHLTSPGISLPA